MDRHVKLLICGIFLIFISTILTSYFGVLRGIYVLLANLTVLLPWLSLVFLESSGKAKEFQSKVIFLFLGMFIALLLIGTSFWKVETHFGHIVEVFVVFMMFPIAVLIFKRRLSKRGKKLLYSAETTREPWGFQWLANISIALKSPESTWVFICLLPAIIGGCLTYRAVTAVEKE